MATIAIAMLPEEGHLIPSFKIAKVLQSQGHTLTYLGIADFEPLVRRQGLAFTPYLEDAFPKGFRDAQVQTLTTQRGLRWLREASHAHFYRLLCQAAQQPTSALRQLLADQRPDLLIVDSFLGPLALLAHSLRIPVVLLSININLPAADNYPPVVTTIVPEDTPASRSKITIAWKISAAIRWLTSIAAGCNFDAELRKTAAACGYPVTNIHPAALMPRVRPSRTMPELILCPQAFDFPHPTDDLEGCFFVEPSLDDAPTATDFPWDAIDPQKPLIFCSLGSQSHIFRHGRRFFQHVLDAFATRPAWQLVLAVGQHIDPRAFQNVPPNALIVPWAPHAAILKRATLMINHAGLGTIKECIYLGVPMLLFPELRDQPGYAARAAYHGLGLQGVIAKTSSEHLLPMLDTVINDPAFKTRVDAMSTLFQRCEHEQRGVQIIEHMLRTGHAPDDR